MAGPTFWTAPRVWPAPSLLPVTPRGQRQVRGLSVADTEGGDCGLSTEAPQGRVQLGRLETCPGAPPSLVTRWPFFIL